LRTEASDSNLYPLYDGFKGKERAGKYLYGIFLAEWPVKVKYCLVFNQGADLAACPRGFHGVYSQIHQPPYQAMADYRYIGRLPVDFDLHGIY
jgi:hypothetical protein